MTVNEPDRHTIERCRRGDRDALRELFDAHGARVYSIARHFFGGNEARARDVTQDVFVKVMDRIGDVRGRVTILDLAVPPNDQRLPRQRRGRAAPGAARRSARRCRHGPTTIAPQSVRARPGRDDAIAWRRQ